MTKRMLIDASHAEETRVVMLDGSRLEEYDVETATRKQLKGNIYLAKVVRVEPSLQAAFVEYGGNRHGFLAFGEIHPDYYQIPVADRQRLLAMEEEEAEAERAAEEAADRAEATRQGSDEARRAPQPQAAEHEAPGEPAEVAELPEASLESGPDDASAGAEHHGAQSAEGAMPGEGVASEDIPNHEAPAHAPDGDEPAAGRTGSMPLTMAPDPVIHASGEATAEDATFEMADAEADRPAQSIVEGVGDAETETVEGEVQEPAPETVGGEPQAPYEREEREERRTSQRLMRHYKIQEVIRRRQILLVQVVKEERGTKGAALTTYISLAGRYCVLMPNSPRGGGVSRKITSAADRRRLKEITAELDIPKGMAMIVRTAGAQRPRPEIKRDCEYLLRLWDDIRDTTMASMAPSLIYEEASLIKRAIRDVYSSDVEEILVDGEEGWRAARGFMRTLMPTHARKVQLWREGQPLFARFNVEGFLDAMMSPSVQLRSGGYLVINQTEALVAIDVNSGRSTRERGIEETAVRTNLEAADEVARQLRLRDLAGLIVIDFIDMESRKHNAMVERRLKDALRQDRARIQVGSISHFGLMEMSRQRLRPSLAENSFVHCEHCHGTGLVRSVESASLHVLRAIEAAGGPRDAAEIAVHVPSPVALYILNNKRAWLAEIERRCVMQVTFEVDDSLTPPAHRIVKTQVRSPADIPAELPPRPVQIEMTAEPLDPAAEPVEIDAEFEEERTERVPASVAAAPASSPAPAETAEETERKRKRRRRRRRGERREDGTDRETGEVETAEAFQAEPLPADMPLSDEVLPFEPSEPISEPAMPQQAQGEPVADGEPVLEESARPKRRRSSRRRRRDDEPAALPITEGPPPAYTGPTPADPFNGAFDIFDALEQDETRYALNTAASAASFAPEPAVEPEAAIAEPEPEPEPAVKPIVVGSVEPPARRSGWWRR